MVLLDLPRRQGKTPASKGRKGGRKEGNSSTIETNKRRGTGLALTARLCNGGKIEHYREKKEKKGSAWTLGRRKKTIHISEEEKNELLRRNGIYRK